MNDNEITVLAEDQFFRVEIHESTSILYVLWKTHLEGEALKERYLTLLNIIKAFKPKSWLGNARAIYYTTVHDARWIFDDFVPLLISSSVSKYARLESPQSLLVLDSIKLQEKINKLPADARESFEFRFFLDEELAITWLASNN